MKKKIITAGVMGIFMMASLAGYTRTCGKKSGGVKSLYLVVNADLASMTLGTLTDSDKWATITMESGKVFKKYEFERGECELKESSTVENDSLKITHSIEFYLAKMSATSQAAVREIAVESACGMVAIAEDMNGLKWVVGYSSEYLKEFPLQLKSAESSTGKVLTDKNGTTVMLESEDADIMRLFTGTIPLT